MPCPSWLSPPVGGCDRRRIPGTARPDRWAVVSDRTPDGTRRARCRSHSRRSTRRYGAPPAAGSTATAHRRCPGPCSTPTPRDCSRCGRPWPTRGGWGSTWPRSSAARVTGSSSWRWSSRRPGGRWSPARSSPPWWWPPCWPRGWPRRWPPGSSPAWSTARPRGPSPSGTVGWRWSTPGPTAPPRCPGRSGRCSGPAPPGGWWPRPDVPTAGRSGASWRWPTTTPP